MKAVLLHDFNEATVDEVPRPEPTGDEVLIEVSRVQLSVTECKLYRGEKIAHYEQIQRRLKDAPTRVLGHEFAGRVVEVGPNVSSFDEGDRVYAPGKIPCLACKYCDAGLRNYCPNKTQIGYDIPGGLAEFVALPEYPLQRIPEGVSDAEGAAMQPFASAVGTVVSMGLTAGDVVAVVGCGVMGNQCAQVAKLEGARRVYAIDIVPEKLEIAAERGLTPIDAREEDPQAVIDDDTGGIGADIVFEAVGGEQKNGTEGNDPLAQAMRIVRRGGRVVQVGHIIDSITITPRTIQSNAVDWLAAPPGVVQVGPNTDTGELAPELVANGDVDISRYISHELEGLESFERMVDITLNKPKHGALGPAQIAVDRD